MLLKHGAHSDCMNIVTYKDGMDFFFMERGQGARFIDFISGYIPIKVKSSRKLVTADHKSNTGNFKNNYIVEIAPLCKDDLVILPAVLAQNLSNITPLVLVKGIGSGIHVVDPLSGERHEVNTEKYWRYEFLPVSNSRQLIKFVLLSVDPLLQTHRPSAKQRGHSKKSQLAECIVAREKDFGMNDTQFTCVTHLGSILKEGDIVLGYDLTTAAWANERDNIAAVKGDIPDVILVRKYYATKGERKWALKNLDVDEKAFVSNNRDIAEEEEELEEFLQEIEGDREMRMNMNIYKKTASSSKAKKSTDASAGTVAMDSGDQDEDEDDDDEEAVRLEELLDDLELTSGLASEGGAQILTAAEAASVPQLEIASSGFDLADFDLSALKFAHNSKK